MNIETVYRRLSYLLAVAGFLSLFITQQLPLYLAILVVLSLIGSYLHHRAGRRQPLPVWFWNTVSIGFFFYEAYMAVYSPRELIVNVAEFLVFLQVVRLWLLETDRDYLQMYGLSLLHFVAGAVMTSELIFSLFFITYILSGTWALVLFNLRREIKGEQRKLREAQAIISVKFLAILSLVSLMVFSMSIVLFLFFPRLNYNYFTFFLTKPTPQSGFSERVRLGEIGQIKLDQTPVMRVSLSGPKARNFSPTELYLRGVTLAHYENGRWEDAHTHQREYITVSRAELIGLKRNPPGKADLIQDIVLEPRGTDVLFAIADPVGIEAPFGVISHRRGGDLLGSFAGSQRVKYRVHSRLARFVEAEEEREFGVEEYLQLPRRFDPRIRAYARELTKELRRDEDKAKKIETTLRDQFQYSLEMVDPQGEDPLAFFLFTRKAGHCEYFGSSMAIMLRALGIPTRLVNGYYHGRYNRAGKYFLIKQSDAHTWVEVLLGGQWMRFDPTPPDPVFSVPITTMERLRQIFDSAQLWWVNWVVDYSIYQQNQALNRFSARTQTLQRDTTRKMREAETFLKSILTVSFRDLRTWVAAITLSLAIGGLLLSIGRTWRIRAKHTQRGQVSFYDDMLRLLRKKGFVRETHDTPQEFVRALKGRSPQLSWINLVQELTDLFCRLRYGNRPLLPEDEAKGRRLLHDLRLRLSTPR